MHSLLFSLLLVVFRSRRAILYPQIFLKSPFFVFGSDESGRGTVPFLDGVHLPDGID